MVHFREQLFFGHSGVGMTVNLPPRIRDSSIREKEDSQTELAGGYDIILEGQVNQEVIPQRHRRLLLALSDFLNKGGYFYVLAGSMARKLVMESSGLHNHEESSLSRSVGGIEDLDFNTTISAVESLAQALDGGELSSLREQMGLKFLVKDLDPKKKFGHCKSLTIFDNRGDKIAEIFGESQGGGAVQIDRVDQEISRLYWQNQTGALDSDKYIDVLSPQDLLGYYMLVTLQEISEFKFKLLDPNLSDQERGKIESKFSDRCVAMIGIVEKIGTKHLPAALKQIKEKSGQFKNLPENLANILSSQDLEDLINIVTEVSNRADRFSSRRKTFSLETGKQDVAGLDRLFGCLESGFMANGCKLGDQLDFLTMFFMRQQSEQSLKDIYRRFFEAFKQAEIDEDEQKKENLTMAIDHLASTAIQNEQVLYFLILKRFIYSNWQRLPKYEGTQN